MNNEFEEDLFLSPFFKLWNRGDGIGEIYLFNSIVAYIHGEQQLEESYYYDQESDSYIPNENYEYQPVSCFPGYLSSSHDLLKHFSNTHLDCLEHLISLIQSLPEELFPPKPKGSILDVFSGQEKFLLPKNFDFEIIAHGANISEQIISHFNSFSHYLKKFLENYPEIKIKFLNHSYLNGNVYFLYELQDKYLLHLVFNQEQQIILGEINRSSRMKPIVILNCSEKNYQFICDSILQKLHISFETAHFDLNVSDLYFSLLPNKKNIFLSDILKTHSDSFISILNNQGSFILERDFQKQPFKNLQFSFNRHELIALISKIKTFDLTFDKFLSLFIHYYFTNQVKNS